MRFRDATSADAANIANLQNAVAADLTARLGKGHWSMEVSEKSSINSLRHARVRVGLIGKRLITVVRLATRKPWAIDVSYFTPVERPLYLTGLAVAIGSHGKGYGSLALNDARVAAAAWPADAIRLDAYDVAGGAGPFYERCGYAPRGRAVYKGNPLLYYELLLARPG